MAFTKGYPLMTEILQVSSVEEESGIGNSCAECALFPAQNLGAHVQFPALRVVLVLPAPSISLLPELLLHRRGCYVLRPWLPCWWV